MNDWKKSAVELLSGGLDFFTTSVSVKSQGLKVKVHTPSSKYGQRHEAEIVASQRIVRKMKVEKHVFASIDLCTFGGSVLTYTEIDVPEHRSTECMILTSYDTVNEGLACGGVMRIC